MKTRTPFFCAIFGAARNGKQGECIDTRYFAPRGACKNACWGASPNPADFGTKCPEVAAHSAFCLRSVAIAPVPYFPARRLRRAGGLCWP